MSAALSLPVMEAARASSSLDTGASSKAQFSMSHPARSSMLVTPA